MSASRLIAVLSAVMAIIAAGLQFFPLKSLARETVQPETPASETAVSFTALADRFDASTLPAPVIPEPVTPPPPPDPAAQLKRYRFIGLAKSEARAAGVFERDGAVLVVAVGDELEGFSLAGLSGASARFINGDAMEAHLPLEKPPTP